MSVVSGSDCTGTVDSSSGSGCSSVEVEEDPPRCLVCADSHEHLVNLTGSGCTTPANKNATAKRSQNPNMKPSLTYAGSEQKIRHVLYHTKFKSYKFFQITFDLCFPKSRKIHPIVVEAVKKKMQLKRVSVSPQPSTTPSVGLDNSPTSSSASSVKTRSRSGVKPKSGKRKLGEEEDEIEKSSPASNSTSLKLEAVALEKEAGMNLYTESCDWSSSESQEAELPIERTPTPIKKVQRKPVIRDSTSTMPALSPSAPVFDRDLDEEEEEEEEDDEEEGEGFVYNAPTKYLVMLKDIRGRINHHLQAGQPKPTCQKEGCTSGPKPGKAISLACLENHLFKHFGKKVYRCNHCRMECKDLPNHLKGRHNGMMRRVAFRTNVVKDLRTEHQDELMSLLKECYPLADIPARQRKRQVAPVRKVCAESAKYRHISSALATLVRMKVNNGETVKCAKCGKRFDTSEGVNKFVQRHILMHFRKPMYKCPICMIKFKAIQDHFIRFHPEIEKPGNIAFAPELEGELIMNLKQCFPQLQQSILIPNPRPAAVILNSSK